LLKVIPTGTRDFSVHQSVCTGSGAHPASQSVGTGGCFPVSKAVQA